ncbi:MAG: zinc-ribbon domain-containing protein, partial [Theionarchaea archaeon]|nr:zinc-ribbon domain-containing protein [Theionarchaea archaeon]
PPGQVRVSQVQSPSQSSRPISRPTPQDIALRREAAERIARETAKEAAQKKAGAKVAEEATKRVGAKVAEEATKKAGTKVAEEATKKAGTKVAEEATKKAGTKVAEEATKKAGTKVAEAAAGAGVTGMVAKRQKGTYCPNCGEKLPPDSKFCSKCGHEI